MSGVLLATGMSLALLAGAARGEEPSPSAPAYGRPVNPLTEFRLPFGAGGICAGLFGLLGAGYFIAGLPSRRHDWKPLACGLFGLGLAVVLAAADLTFDFWAMASRQGCSRENSAFVTFLALQQLAVGLGAAMFGGLLTVILRWRNERFRSEAARSGADKS